MSISEYFQPCALLSAVLLDCKTLRFQATFCRIRNVSYVLKNMVHHLHGVHPVVYHNDEKGYLQPSPQQCCIIY
jgi:hypothetical protein